VLWGDDVEATPDGDAGRGAATAQPGPPKKRRERRAADPSKPVLQPAWLRELLRLRLGLHVEEFARVILPDHFRLPFSKLHGELLRRRAPERLACYAPDRTGHRLAVAAPRGAAKSTIVSLLLPLHDFLYGQERYIVLLSATDHQARRRLAQLRAVLESNTFLARLFPDYAGRRARGLAIANEQTLRLNDGAAAPCRIDAYGAGSELRGLADGAHRPTRIILDDIEANRIATSPEARRALKEWYDEVIEPLGDRSTHLDIVGTVLHPESLLAELLHRPEFESLRFASILKWSPRDDLWERWRSLRSGASGEVGDGMTLAATFFAKHRDTMLADTDVLWPERESYSELIEQLTRMGRRAFLKEKQNDPSAPDGAIFDEARVVWFDVLERGDLRGSEGASAAKEHAAAGSAPPTGDSSRPLIDPSRMSVVAFLDPATGSGGGRGDDAAIAVIARHPGDDILWLLDVWMAAVVPTRQVEEVWNLHERWGIATLGFEANLFQGMLADPLERTRAERRRAGRPSAVSFRPIRNHANKEERIMALEPLLLTGRLRMRRGLSPRFLAQFEQWPHTAHDDGLDAVAAAVALADQLMPATMRGVVTARRPRGSF
jgi:predicted phage terminase large subunit-like protein